MPLSPARQDMGSTLDPDHKPALEPKSDPFSSVNHLEEDENSSWSFVGKKGKAKGRRKGGKAAGSLSINGISGVQVPRPPPTLTEEDIRREHDRIVEKWRASPSAEALETLLATKISPEVSDMVERAICLGNGSFDPPGGVRQHRWGAHVQTEAFLTLVRAIEKAKGKKVPCVFQEPLYTEPDKAFLRSLGHMVEDTPAGFQQVGPNTLLYGIHLYTPDYCTALRQGLPAILIGNDQAVALDTLMWNGWEMYAEQLKDLEARYQKIKFPRERDDNCFSNTCIYLQRTTVPEVNPTPTVDDIDLAALSLDDPNSMQDSVHP